MKAAARRRQTERLPEFHKEIATGPGYFILS